MIQLGPGAYRPRKYINGNIKGTVYGLWDIYVRNVITHLVDFQIWLKMKWKMMDKLIRIWFTPYAVTMVSR